MKTEKVLKEVKKWESEITEKQKYYINKVNGLSYNENWRSVKVGVDNVRINLDLLMIHTDTKKPITEMRLDLETYILSAKRSPTDKGMKDRLINHTKNVIDYLRENKRIK